MSTLGKLALWLTLLILPLFTNVTVNARIPPPPYWFWYDPKCTQRDKACFMIDYINEMFYMARSAANHVRDWNDRDFQRVFELIFKQSWNGAPWPPHAMTNIFSMGDLPNMATKDWVSSTFLFMAENWKETNNRLYANLRIYCDDVYMAPGGRYEAHGPTPMAPFYKMYDTQNTYWRRATAGNQIHDCDAHPDRTFAASGIEMSGRRDDSSVTWFATIDICQNLWNQLHEADQAESDINWVPRSAVELAISRGGDLHNLPVPKLSKLWPVMVLMNQWLTVPPALLELPNTADGTNSGWEYLMGLTAADLAFHPEAYSMLALWAALADIPVHEERGGYTIDREWAQLPENMKYVDFEYRHPNYPLYENRGYRGNATAYRDLTGIRNIRLKPPTGSGDK